MVVDRVVWLIVMMVRWFVYRLMVISVGRVVVGWFTAGAVVLVPPIPMAVVLVLVLVILVFVGQIVASRLSNNLPATPI